MLYKAVDVWKRKSREELVRYRCFELLSEKKYCVQSADYYKLPLNEQNYKELDKQFLELFLEEAPEERNNLFSSIEEAIETFDRQFGNS